MVNFASFKYVAQKSTISTVVVKKDTFCRGGQTVCTDHCFHYIKFQPLLNYYSYNRMDIPLTVSQLPNLTAVC